MIRLLSILILGIVCALAIFELRHRTEGLLELQFDPLTQSRELYSTDRLAEAVYVAEHLIENPHLARSPGDIADAQTIINDSNERMNSLSGKVQRFVDGAVTGEPKDLVGFVGSMSLDLFVVGDVRDLLVQGYREVTTSDGDKIILALSAAGLATTLVPAVDWAPSLMKAFKRLGKFSEAFAKNLTRLARRALKLNDYDELGSVAVDFGRAAKNLKPGPLAGIMKLVDKPSELRKLSLAAKINPRATYMVASGTRKAGINQLLSNGSNISRIASKLRRSSRLIKSFRKATRIIPTLWLTIIAGVSGFLALSLLIRGLVGLRFTRR